MVRVCHDVTAVFDDPNFVSCAGLAPVLQLAERAGLQQLVADHVRIDEPGGRTAHLKVPSLVAGMVAGAFGLGRVAAAAVWPKRGAVSGLTRAERRNLAQGSAGAFGFGGYGFGRGVQRLFK